ncbi:MAG TPA: hypothetical protein ENH82_14690 [bacterium]|nr:hypothetical protein [bacterium]
MVSGFHYFAYLDAIDPEHLKYLNDMAIAEPNEITVTFRDGGTTISVESKDFESTDTGGHTDKVEPVGNKPNSVADFLFGMVVGMIIVLILI